MRNILILLLLPIEVIAQRPSKANKVILEFAEKNIGKKVGDGICRTLTNDAIYEYRKSYGSKSKKIDHKYNSPGLIVKDTAKWSGGDLILLSYVVTFSQQNFYTVTEKHIGVLKSVDKEKIIYYNQNSLKPGETTKKNSKVVQDTLFLSQIIGGDVKIFRIY